MIYHKNRKAKIELTNCAAGVSANVIENTNMNTLAGEIRAEIRAGRSNADIAEWLGCSRDRVADEKRSMRMREKRAPGGGKHQGPEIRMLLAEGARVCDIAVKLGCCESTVHRHKKAMNDE